VRMRWTSMLQIEITTIQPQ